MAWEVKTSPFDTASPFGAAQSRLSGLVLLPALLLHLPSLSACDKTLSVSAAGAAEHVEHQRPSICAGLLTRTVRVPALGQGSDAFQVKKSGVTYVSTSGEVYTGRSAYHGNVISALRFIQVPVPRHARVEAASVRLVDAHSGDKCCLGEDITVLLRLEEAGNSTPLPRHQTEGWLLSRLGATASQSWRPPVSHAYNVTETPDLSKLVQVVVDLDEWSGGNAMTLLMDGEGQTKDMDERIYFGSATHFRENRATLSLTFCELPGNMSSVERKDAESAVADVPACPPAVDCPKCLREDVETVLVVDRQQHASSGQDVDIHLVPPDSDRGPKVPVTTTIAVGFAMLLAGAAALAVGRGNSGVCSIWDEESEGL